MYVYCNNNAVMMYDPDGKEPLWWYKKGHDFMKEVFEAFPEFVENTKTFITSYGPKIPDFIDKNVIGEIKNVKYLYLSAQIKGFIEIAKTTSKKFILVVEKGTKLSKPLIKEIKKVGGAIVKYGSNTTSNCLHLFYIFEPQVNMLTHQQQVLEGKQIMY